VQLQHWGLPTHAAAGQGCAWPACVEDEHRAVLRAHLQQRRQPSIGTSSCASSEQARSHCPEQGPISRPGGLPAGRWPAPVPTASRLLLSLAARQVSCMAALARPSTTCRAGQARGGACAGQAMMPLDARQRPTPPPTGTGTCHRPPSAAPPASRRGAAMPESAGARAQRSRIRAAAQQHRSAAASPPCGRRPS
jgi:hypothetical protein